MTTQISPPPRTIKDRVVFRWLSEVFTKLTAANEILWTQVDKATSAISDIEDRSHSLLDNVLSVDETSSDTEKNKHTSNALEKASADHQTASNAHGATGNIVGVGDVATTLVAGTVLQATATTDLNQTISGTYTQSEVQDISDKIDELLGVLRTAGVIDN